MVEFDQLF